MSQIGGTINEAGTVVFRIEQYDVTSTNYFYWNNSSWIANGDDPSVYLPAVVTGGTWLPAGSVTLPGRGQLQYGHNGHYFLRAIGTSLAGDSSTNEILVSRSATDTTPPIVNLDSTSIHPNDVFTNPFLPSVFGLAYDGESGVASVSVLLARNIGPGMLVYWTGSAWSSDPTNLPASYNAQNISWQLSVPLPSGANLPNGSYSLDVSAENNEVPAGEGSDNLNFSVDYHPVYVFNYGSQFGPTPNMKWDSPDNWDVGQEPGPDAIVVINGYAPDSTALGTLQIYALNMSGGTLNAAGLSIQKLNFSGGQINANALTLSGNKTNTWSGGGLNVGTLIVSANAMLALTNDINYDVPNCTITNYGSVVWRSGTIRGGYNGTQIANYGTWDAQSDATLNNAYGYNGTVFNNFGTFQKSGGASTNQTSFPDVPFNQLAGVLDVQQGNLSLQAGASFSGGYVTTNSTGATLLAAGNFNINGTVTSSNVLAAGGSLIGNDVIRGALTFASGSWGATVTVATNGTLYLAGSANLDISSTILTNNGAVRWSSGTLRGGYNGTQIYNYGIWEAQSDATLNNAYGYAGTVFNNFGTFQKSAGASTNQTVFDSVPFNQFAGVLDVQHGNLSLQAGANFSGGFITTNSTGTTLLAAGGFDINGAVTSSNVVENGGALVGNNVIYGALTWLAGVWDSTTVSVSSNSTIYLAGSGNLNMPSTIVTNNGAVRWGAGTLRGGYNGTQIYNYGIWEAQSDATLNNAYGYNGTVFNNFGVFRKSAGASTNQTVFDSVPLNQFAGVLDVQHGILSLQAGANFNGGFVTTNSTGTTLLAAGGFNFNGGITSSNVVENGGVLAGNNVINGALTWLAGNWNGTTVTVTTNSTVYLAGPANLDLVSMVLTNNGTVLWTSGFIQGGGGAPGTYIVNNSLWDIRGDLTLNDAFGSAGTLFNNFGTLRKSIGSGGTNQTVFAPGMFLNQLAGKLDVQQGNLSLQGGANFSGGFVTTNSIGTTLLAAGGFNFSGGMTSSNVVENGGVLVGNNLIQGALLWLVGNWNSSTVTVTTNSSVYLAGPANLDLRDCSVTNFGAVRWRSGTLQGGYNGTQIYNYGIWEAQSDATLNNTFGYNGTVFNNFGVLQKSAGASTNQTVFDSVSFNQLAGVLDVQQGNFSLQGGANFSGGFVTTNSTGTTLLVAGGFNFNGGMTSSNVVENGGVLVGNNLIQGGLTWLAGNWNSTTVTVTTNSTVYLAGPANLDLRDCSVTNFGAVRWRSGTLQGGYNGTQIANYGIWEAQSDATLNNAFGYNGTVFNNFGTLRKEFSTGTTTFAGGVSLNNSGAVDLRSGVLAIAGYSASPSEQTKIILGGINPGTQFGSESFSGLATFDGTLTVLLTNNFTPTNGQSFVIANYPSFTGNFATTQLPPLPVVSHWLVAYTPGALVLQVVPANAFQSSSLTNGNFQFAFAGQTGSSCLIEVSTNLLTWLPLITNAPFNGTLIYTDPQSAQFNQRFYRATIFP